MMQGDAYRVPFILSMTIDGTRTLLTPDNVEDVEILIGTLRATYSEGELKFDDGKWCFPLTQQKTFSLGSFAQFAQVRVKFITGDVVGAIVPKMLMNNSISKAVL